jgi:DNA polymerase elongation subunit (family B)
MALVLDIETVGQPAEAIPPRALDYLFRKLERDAPEPEELERRREDLVARFGLDPTTGRVIVAGTLDTETGDERAFAGDDERLLLEAFWEFVEQARPRRLVTFSGRRFDVPYLNVRSAILGLRPAVPLPSGDAHFDVREALEAEDRRRVGSLDYFCAVFGIPSPKTELDGTRIGEAYAAGRLEDIVRYCFEDCRATAALYERIDPFFR